MKTSDKPALPRYALKLTAAQRANGSKDVYLRKMASKHGHSFSDLLTAMDR